LVAADPIVTRLASGSPEIHEKIAANRRGGVGRGNGQRRHSEDSHPLMAFAAANPNLYRLFPEMSSGTLADESAVQCDSCRVLPMPSANHFRPAKFGQYRLARSRKVLHFEPPRCNRTAFALLNSLGVKGVDD
jgi:hypothetical protein